MGVKGVVNLSDLYRPQNVQDSVSDWLRSGCRQFHNTEKVSHSTSLLGQGPRNADSDRGSVAIVDDNVSTSDSAHESSSTASSSRSPWTITTDPTDVFSDEEEKEHLPQAKPCDGSRASIELQEQLLRGLQASNQSAYSGLPSLNHLTSRAPRSQTLDRSGKCARATVESHGLDTTDGCHVPKITLRRSLCSSNNQVLPPKLKRDTDVTDHFVSLLIVFATRLITAIWPLSACPPMMSTCFNGAGVLPLRVFIQETLRRSKTSYSTLQVALYYLILLKAKLPCAESTEGQKTSPPNGEGVEGSQCRAMQCGRRMFLAALMLASKYLQDRNYSARAWSKISGLRSSEINENEREYLLKIDYNLHVPKDDFDNWSNIVLALSRLSKEAPQCRPRSGKPDSGRPGGGNDAVLANMVSEGGAADGAGEPPFSDKWWADVIQDLDPAVVKDTQLVNAFLQKHLPEDKAEQVLSPSFSHQQPRSWDALPPAPDNVAQVYDMNFSDTLKPRAAEQCRSQTPQTPKTPQIPMQTSPVRSSCLPMQPHLRNLPTPQTTPQLGEKCPWAMKSSRPSLRCSASVDALRSMRRQCLMNANLERCPPPRPQACDLPPVKNLMRPAETIREVSSRSTTPTSSPASLASELTAYTSRSRSSSVSSSSSWSSLASAVPRLHIASGGRSSSPLARVCTSSDAPTKGSFDGSMTSAHALKDGTTPDITGSSFRGRICSRTKSTTTSIKVEEEEEEKEEEWHGSQGRLRPRISRQCPQATQATSEVDAARVLMSLSAHSETPSQSVTPTPQRLSGFADDGRQDEDETPRRHKRSLSKTESKLQSRVRTTLRSGCMRVEGADGAFEPYYEHAPKEWQIPTRDWATPRKAISKNMDTKRVATYCSMQQFASAPDLASQYLKDSMIIAS